MAASKGAVREGRPASFYWLAAWPPLAFGSAAAFGSVFVLSCFAAYASAHKRIIAV